MITEEEKRRQEMVRQALQGVGVRPTPTTPVVTPSESTSTVASPPMTDYDYLQQFANDYTPEVLSNEEMERRKKAAYSIQGIGALGNAASALSNLIYASKGAPSQELPKNVDASAAITQLEEHERVKRNEVYQRAKERVAQKMAKDKLAYQQQKDAQDLKIKAGEFQLKLDELALKRQEAERKGNLDGARLLETQWKAVKAQQDALYAPKRHEAYVRAQNASANRSNAAASADKEKGALSIPYNSGQAAFKIRKDDWNNATLLGAFADALDLPITWDKPVKKSTSMEDLAFLLRGENLPADQAAGGTITTPEGLGTYYTKEQLQMIIGQALNDPANAAKVKSLIDLYEGRKPEVIKYEGSKKGSDVGELEYYE